MVQIAEPDTIPDTIEATLNYLLDTGEMPVNYVGMPGDRTRNSGKPDPRRVASAAGRPGRSAPDRNAFRFARREPKVAGFFDEDEIRRVYSPEMVDLVKQESGASRVVVFDHTLRTADDEERATRKIREVVRRVHNDYTEWSAPQRVRDILPDEAEAL